MRILFVVAPFAGHVLPLVPLAWAARVAGHDTLFAVYGKATPFVVRAGLAAVEVVEAADLMSDVHEDSLSDIWPHVQGNLLSDFWRGLFFDARERGAPQAGMISPSSSCHVDTKMLVKREEWGSVRDLFGTFGVDELINPAALFFGYLSELAIDPIIRVAEGWGAEAVVYEPCMVAGLVAAKVVGIPAFCHGFGVWHPWPIPAVSAMIESRKRYGLTDITWEPMADIDVCPESIRPSRLNLGWSMRYTPYNNEAVLPAWLLGSPSRRPRVCVTVGTIISDVGRMGPLDAIIDALSECDVDVIVLGAEGAMRKPLSNNIRSTGWLPLNAVLPTCSAIIHHGGSGTTFTALAAGVPQLVIPQFADQPVNAAAVASRGVGIHLPESAADPASVRDLLSRLLDDRAISQAATEVREEIAAMPPPSEIVERLTTAASIHLGLKRS
ncbi:MAG: nucleotide disphospho-sugar-binding domain-containing protein [Pseudonocardiaceae bacterium]